MFTKKYMKESINILNKIEIKVRKIISVIANVRKKKEEFFSWSW